MTALTTAAEPITDEDVAIFTERLHATSSTARDITAQTTAPTWSRPTR